MTEYRIERDSMGEVKVPVEAKWRAQTQRAVENFPISGQGLEAAHIAALGHIKAAAAKVNAELGVIKEDMAEAIREAALEVAAGKWNDQFPVDVFQTGSGTSSNMNANEVIATLATERLGQPVHPNDHVNASQSSNDVFPSSIHIAATSALINELIPALKHLEETLSAKASEFATVVKSGRTHLMDATPVTLGQEFDGYAAQVRYGIERIEASLPRVAELPLGGTAVGTGINTPEGFSAKVIAEIARATGLPLTEARNHFEAQGARDAHPVDGFGSADRSQRDLPAGLAAGVVDHAGQGQPGAVRVDAPGGLAGGGERCRGGVRRVDRQLRAERATAADRPQRAGVDPAAGQHFPGVRGPVRGRDHR